MKRFNLMVLTTFGGLLFISSLFAQIQPLSNWKYKDSTFYYVSGLMDRTNNSPDSLTVFLTNQEINCDSIPIEPSNIGGAWIEVEFPDLTIRNYAIGEIWAFMSCYIHGSYWGSYGGYIGSAGLTSVDTGRLQGWIDFYYESSPDTFSAYGSFDIPYCVPPVSVREDYYAELPITFELHHNYPNPFNPTTTIKFEIPELSFVTLKVYDVLGSEVITLVNEEKPIGSYEVEFSAIGRSASGGNAYTLPSGIYFYQIKAGMFTDTKKFILIK